MISVFKLVEVSLNARAFDQGARGSRCNLQKWPKMKRGVCLENGQAGVQETVVLVMDKNLSLMARTHIQKKKKCRAWVHICNTRTGETKASRSLELAGHKPH